MGEWVCTEGEKPNDVIKKKTPDKLTKNIWG